MRAFIKEMNQELEKVAPHILEYGENGKVRVIRNPDCPHCDILAEYMMKDPSLTGRVRRS
jgi:hypothetical protein